MSNCIPDTLYAKIRVKRSLVPLEVPSHLELGELAVNIEDKKIYVGNQFNQPVLLQGSGGVGNGIYSAGSGITISGTNVISFNQNTLPNYYIEIQKIKAPTNQNNGYLFYNGSGWSLQSISLNFDNLFACLGGVANNKYFIDGGNASGTTCGPA